MSNDETRREIRRSRTNVIGYLLKLNRSIDARHLDLVQALAHRFSDALIDYTSYGQLRLLDLFHAEPHHLAALEKITQSALAFNARYAQASRIDLEALKADLEEIALAMEVRFEIEDEMAAAAA